MIVIEATGPLALLQDLGRPFNAHLGVSPSGAADRSALRLANRLVGNAEGAVAVEVTFGGLEITALDLVWVAVTGAPTQVLVNDTPNASHTALTLRPADRLTVEAPAQGLRNYLSVRGGLDTPLVLGSSSRDILSGLGPEPLVPGQRLVVGTPTRPLPDAESAPAHQPRKTLELTPGPRFDWFDDRSWRRLLDEGWTVTADCDRVAVRLDGPGLTRLGTDELPSEGLLRGAIQVPPSGQPLIFLADHPVTGGYPVIAVLTDRAADHAAQLRPGDSVRFEAARPLAQATR